LILAALVCAMFLLGAVMWRTRVHATQFLKAPAIAVISEKTMAAGSLTPVEEAKSRANALNAYFVGLDALFIVLYVGSLTVGCRIAIDGYTQIDRRGLATAGVVLAWAAVIAGLFDVAENLGQLQQITGEISPERMWMTPWFTRLKLLLALPAAVYIVAAMTFLRSRFFA
jgi:hypothetical protein